MRASLGGWFFPAKTPGGFSLLELVLAMAFFAIAFPSLMDAYNRGVFADLYVDRGAIAVNLAQERVEELKRGTYASVVPGTVTENPVAGFAPFQRVSQVAVNGANPNTTYKTVTVTVTWFMKNVAQTYVLTTYIANY